MLQSRTADSSPKEKFNLKVKKEQRKSLILEEVKEIEIEEDKRSDSNNIDDGIVII